MFSFLQKINPNKKKDHYHVGSGGLDGKSVDLPPSGASSEGNGAGNTFSLLKSSKKKNQAGFLSTNNCDLLLKTNGNNAPGGAGVEGDKKTTSATVDGVVVDSSLISLTTTTPIKSSSSFKNSPFSRKSNLSLSSISSGYFTTGRFSDKKKASASLGAFLNLPTKISTNHI